MKTLKAILFIMLLSPVFALSQTNRTEKIEAYYFHNATRCVTCKTVEAEAKTDLQELYGDKITFQAFNLEEKSTDAIAKKLNVSGQTLLVVKGDKQVNLTNDGFLYAVTNPEKFKKIIKEKVDPLVK